MEGQCEGNEVRGNGTEEKRIFVRKKCNEKYKSVGV